MQDEVAIDDLLWRTQQVIEHERDVIDDQLRRNRVDVIPGSASFVDPHTLAIDVGGARHLIGAERIVIAVGTRPRGRPASTSTTAPCSTPTASCGCATSRAR